MTTAPVLDPGDFRPTERDPATLQFHRLERMRSLLRARRRRRWILFATLVMVVAGAGIAGFSTVRRTAIERAAASTTPARALEPGPAPVVGAVIRVPTTIVPAPPPVNGANREMARPSPQRSDSPRVPAPPRDEGRDEARDSDPTAAIDWLLNTSRAKGP
jgi:hypothetical protein